MGTALQGHGPHCASPTAVPIRSLWTCPRILHLLQVTTRSWPLLCSLTGAVMWPGHLLSDGHQASVCQGLDPDLTDPLPKSAPLCTAHRLAQGTSSLCEDTAGPVTTRASACFRLLQSPAPRPELGTLHALSSGTFRMACPWRCLPCGPRGGGGGPGGCGGTLGPGDGG